MTLCDLYIMSHRGQALRECIENLGVSITTVSQKLGVSRSTMYNYFGNENLPWSIIYQIGLIINHDFRKEFPEMPIADIEKNEEVADNFILAEEPDTVYELRKKLVQLRDKYMTLLEEHNALLKGKGK